MKYKVINAAICDTREVTEESLAGFESITINAAVVITGERSMELLNRYHVTLNSSNVMEIPDEAHVTMQVINGKGEIGPETDGTGVLLVVNGRLTVADGGLEAARSYYKIQVNGRVLVPRSFQGQLSNLSVNGRTEYYPDGAALLKPDTRVDDLFAARATHSCYYCPGHLFFPDAGTDPEKLAVKGLRFSARKVVVAESLLDRLLPMIDEEADIVRVPDGACLVDGDLELNAKALRKYGTKLIVTGDVTIDDGKALSSLEYLLAEGTVTVTQELADAFDAVNSEYGGLKVVDPELGYIADRPMVKAGPAMLKKYPKGVRIEDCARVTLAADLTPEEILEKLKISDCALVICSSEQEEAVSMITEDVAMIRVSKADEEEEEGGFGGMLGSFLDQVKNTQVINSAEYRM